RWGLTWGWQTRLILLAHGNPLNHVPESCKRPSGHDNDDASDRLLRPPAKIVDQTYLAARLAGEARVAPVQDQPVMGVQHEFGRDHLFQPEFDLQRRIAGRQPRAVAD